MEMQDGGRKTGSCLDSCSTSDVGGCRFKSVDMGYPENIVPPLGSLLCRLLGARYDNLRFHVRCLAFPVSFNVGVDRH